MRIYQMTATFGKLEHQTLTLKPGLNIITAPNEWGKSTWCAFLVAMLYGLDTRAKTTKNALADKDRYAPWSGAPMEGRIDLNWKGRDITIQRKSTRRIPLGEFAAYETKTGLPVTELTAANCGQQLLGVEQSVFRRSGFVRLADLPVTQDEALRRRLNALVTTGDESAAADTLAETLKDLRNKCRYNRTGLLPQAENERDTLQGRLRELESLESQCLTYKMQIGDLKEWISQLKNHQQAIAYSAAQENARRSALAREDLDKNMHTLQQLERACAALPSRDQLRQKAAAAKQVAEEWSNLQLQLKDLPEAPIPPEAPAPFTGMPVDQARSMVHQDAQDYVAAKHTGMAVLLIVMGLLGTLCAGVLVFLRSYLFAAATAIGSLAAFVWGIVELRSMKKRTKTLRQKYGTKDHSRWAIPLTEYEKRYRHYLSAMKSHQGQANQLQSQITAVTERKEAICGNMEPQSVINSCTQALRTWEDYEAAYREAERAQSHYDALSALVRHVEKPAFPDKMTQSEEDTQRLLSECTQELNRLQNRLGQHQGRMDMLGSRSGLQSQLEQKEKRIAQLEDTCRALQIAQETLVQAREELQRRFAPKITRRAQDLMSRMTDGRYSSITMDTELSVRTAAASEDVLREALWRSDGTVDQLYLALRLAVSEELTPQAPLVLDDALVRFDDRRMKAALSLLEEIALHKQVILFTCQTREQNL